MNSLDSSQRVNVGHIYEIFMLFFRRLWVLGFRMDQSRAHGVKTL